MSRETAMVVVAFFGFCATVGIFWMNYEADKVAKARSCPDSVTVTKTAAGEEIICVPVDFYSLRKR